MTRGKWTPGRIARGVGRRVPLRPFRVVFPYGVWRPLFRLWLGTIRSQPDRSRAMRQLLQVYDDAYAGVDLGAITYDDGVHAKHRLTRYHDFFVDRVHQGERVLDVGCGKGELAHDLAERSGATVIAIDAQPVDARIRARALLPSERDIRAGRRGRLQTGAEPVDVAILSNVLEHIEPRVELLRALREGAGARRLLIRVPSRERDWTVPLKQEVGLPHFSDPEHKLEYDPQLLRDELAAAGWDMGEPLLNWGEIWVEASAR